MSYMGDPEKVKNFPIPSHAHGGRGTHKAT